MQSDTERTRQVSDEHERDAIQHVEDVLHESFPAVRADTIDAVVEHHYHELDGSQIRDYVPVLVENAAKADLAALSSIAEQVVRD